MDAGNSAEASTSASLSGTIPIKASVFLFIATLFYFARMIPSIAIECKEGSASTPAHHMRQLVLLSGA
jgi:hypothetical protein